MAKTKTLRNRIEFSGFENEIHLSEFIDFDLDYKVGAFVLQQQAEGRRTFRFGFESPGIHSSLDEARFLQAFSMLEKGLKQLPFGETITFKISSFSESANRIRQLQKLLDRNDNPGIRLLLISEQEKAREMQANGQRQPKTLRLYCTFTPDKFFHRRGKSWQTTFFEKMLGEGAEFVQDRLDKAAYEKKTKQLFADIYQNGFKMWQRHITERMGLTITPLAADDLWAELWQKFSDKPVPDIPQVIRVTENVNDPSGVGLDYKIEENSDLSAATVLTRHGVPVDDEQWVKVKDKYVGVLTYLEKPRLWDSERDQLAYLWNVIARDDTGDCEVICQFKTNNKDYSRQSMQRIAANADSRQQKKKAGSDRSAAFKQSEAEEAEDSIMSGDIPLSVGVAFLVYRDTQRQLNEACATISSQFHAPAWVDREINIAWKIWAQCLPTCQDRLLFKAMYNRTKTHRVSECMGFTPIFKTGTQDTEGVELHSEDGSSVFVNLFDFSNPIHMALFGTTRSGKSVLVADFLTHALAYGLPIIAMDFPDGKGRSTFYDYCKILGKDAAYYNIADECNNIFEQPNFTATDPELLKAQKNEFLASLTHIVLSLVGESGDITIDEEVKTVLAPLLTEFIEREDIQQRYTLAHENGLGTEEWQDMPTLHDFKAHIPIESDIQSIQRAYDRIHSRFRYWLKSPIADAIAKPSSFKSDAMLIVFALTNVTDDEDAAILGLAAYSAAIRRSLSHPASIFFVDESPILLQFAMISKLLSNLTSNFGKAGGRVILTAQTVMAIANCGHADQILGNCAVKLIGRITPGQEQSYIDNIGMDSEQAHTCSSENFIRKKGQNWTNWMLAYGGKMYRVKFFPSDKLLFAVANNQTEQKTREYFMKYLPVDLALDATAHHLRECEKQGKNPLEHLPELEILKQVQAELETSSL